MKKFAAYLTPLSLIFISVGKFVFAFLIFFRFLDFVAGKNVHVWEVWFLRYFFAIFSIFIIWAGLGLFYENDWHHILRNNFLSLFFFLGPLTLFWGVSSVDDLIDRLSVLVLVLSFGLFGFIVIYVLSLFGVGFHKILSVPFFRVLGYNFAFSGPLFEFSGIFFQKVFSGISGVYVYLIPFCFLVLRSWFFICISLVLAILMSSAMLYLVLLLYIFIFLIIKVRYFHRYALALIMISGLVVVGFVSGPFKDMPISQKVSELVSGDYDYSARSSKVPSTIGVRVIQYEALLVEFSKSPVLGKGLGYQSSIYNDIRSDWGNLKEFNKSMYELQFMDVLMKFGVVGSFFVFLVYIFFPFIFSFRYIFFSDAVLASFVGHFGLVVYSLNNGNYFYSYGTMFCWGVTVYLMFFYRLNMRRFRPAI